MKSFKAADIARKWALVVIIAMMAIVFGSMQKSYFTTENMINILRQTAIMGILAVGLTFVIVSGEMDLSFSMVSSLSAILVLMMCIKKYNPIVSWVVVLLIGILLGFVNGIVVVKLGIPSLLGTIGTQLLFGGIVSWIANGGTIWTARYSPLFTFPGRGVLFGFLPLPVLILLVVAVIALIILEKSVLGRYFYAVGGNAKAADHAGIDAKKIKFIGYIIMGFLGSVAGIIIAAQFASATPSAGATYLFPAIIAVYLGSIFLKDGVPNLWGTIVASLFLSVLSNGIVLIGLKYWHENVAQGVIMIAAIAIMLAGKRKGN